MKKMFTPQLPVGPAPETRDVPDITPPDNPPAWRPKKSAPLWRFMACCVLSLVMGGCTPAGSGPQTNGTATAHMYVRVYPATAAQYVVGRELGIYHPVEFSPEVKILFKRMPSFDKNGKEAWGMDVNLTKGVYYDLRLIYNNVVVPGSIHRYLHDGSDEVIMWEE